MINTNCHPTVSKLLFTAILLLAVGISPASELVLAVANSTCTAIKKVGHLYQQSRDIEVIYICKSSGRLAKGLKGGAIEADIYISANRKWMEVMVDAALVASSQVVALWGNELVVAAPKTGSVKSVVWEDLASDKIKTILIGDPGTAPFGRYAKEALESTGLWERVRNKIATKKHITLLADALAESDGNTLGILFLSNITSKLRVIHLIDRSWHSPIRYYMAPMKSATKDEHVASFLTFMYGDAAREIFLAEGFTYEAP